MQSAACYLAISLAARGHSVALMNRTTTPGCFGGVTCINVSTVNAPILNGFDVVVSICTGSVMLRQMGLTRPLVLWIGHDTNQPAVRNLCDFAERWLWDKVVLVSNWQATRYLTEFKFKSDQISVLRYAVAPAFEKKSRNRPYFFITGAPPILIYSSTPFRGLDVLLRSFPLIRATVPECEAKIYSSMLVYQVPPEKDSYHALYNLCRMTEGVNLVGSVGQDTLAEAMNRCDVFAYPSTFPETSCIALMEAMASGCIIVSTTLGALPETAAGFGGLLNPPAVSGGLAEIYAQFAAQTIRDAYKNPEQWVARLDEQRAFALKNYSWSARAKEWEELLEFVTHQPARLAVPVEK
jgi:glycosyltransferase involved in cell wall biosynthesis